MKFIFVILFVISTVTFAKETRPTDIYTAADLYEKYDIRMNLDYVELMNVLTAKVNANIEAEYHTELRKRIIYNQRAWLNYRDSYCELTALREGNTRAVLFYEINCMYLQTKERLSYIQVLTKLVISDTAVTSLP
jgi:uncharacterized protein YecT (DUF1311 family)